MKLDFYKYQGTGNDFVLIDNRKKKIVLTKEQIARICNRNFGIGADGLMLLEKEKGFDFKMVYYNSDGGESTMCGNGGRCITAFAKELGVIKKKAKFIAVDGAHTAFINNGLVKLGMIDPGEIKQAGKDHTVNTGSPHYVSFVKEFKKADVYTKGHAIRNSAAYKKEGINVNFVEELKPNVLFVRTYERGVENETLSCGTGVTAAAIVYASIKKAKSPIEINTLGGKLNVYFENKEKQFKNVFLEGPAVLTFKGKIEI